MGLFKKSVGLADIIRCDERNYLIWKWHPIGTQLGEHKRENEIRWGSSLRVKDGEVAVFVYKQKDGTIQDYFEGPCDKILETMNFPVLSSVLGAAFNKRSPFQAEIYFINTSYMIQTKFAVPFFDVFDPRMPDCSVPVAVRGTISYRISNIYEFIRLHRLDNFDQEDFYKQVHDAIVRYVKDAVANAPAKNGIPVVQIESRIGQITDIVERNLSQRLENTFGVKASGVDIAAIEIDKSSKDYAELSSLTKSLAKEKFEARENAYMKTIVEADTSGQLQNGTPLPPPIPTVKYNVAIGGKPAGPFDIETLCQMAQSNQLNAESLVWKPGMSNWIALKEVQELDEVLSSIPPKF